MINPMKILRAVAAIAFIGAAMMAGEASGSDIVVDLVVRVIAGAS